MHETVPLSRSFKRRSTTAEASQRAAVSRSPAWMTTEPWILVGTQRGCAKCFQQWIVISEFKATQADTLVSSHFCENTSMSLPVFSQCFYTEQGHVLPINIFCWMKIPYSWSLLTILLQVTEIMKTTAVSHSHKTKIYLWEQTQHAPHFRQTGSEFVHTSHSCPTT